MLKTILLRKKLDEAKKKLENARSKSGELKVREAELETAINEANTDEEKQAVEEEVAAYETEKEANDQDVRNLEQEISDTEIELAELENKQRTVIPMSQERERGERYIMRKKFFGMSNEERNAFFDREDVKKFIERVRMFKGVTRTVQNAELNIPTVVLDLLRENINDYSKLNKRVNVIPVSGKARQNIMGTIPEAIWTETCGILNELEMSFNDVEVDGYKVSGYFAICNAILEDSDINLAEAVLTALGQAIGYALDKAILYGTGNKMPQGIVTRLAQTVKPDAYPDTARTWEDLHQSNIKSIAPESTGIDLFKKIVTYSAAAKNKYSNGNKFWAMNEKTKTTLIAEALSFNASGAIATGMNDVMPVIGGDIEVLDFIPDDNIVGGYGDLYLLAERAGTTINTSEHVKFIEDRTVFKGTARYDGKPSIAEAFVVIGINGATPTTAMAFAEDKANKIEG